MSMRTMGWVIIAVQALTLLFLIFGLVILYSCSGVRVPVRPESKPAPESVPESAPESAESKPVADAGATYSAIGIAREAVVYDGAEVDSGFKCRTEAAAGRVEDIRAAVLAVMNRIRDLEAAASKEARAASAADAARFEAASSQFALACRDEATICESDHAEIACYSAISMLLLVAELYAEALAAPSPR